MDKNQLFFHLNSLKETIHDFDYQSVSNVIFLNKNSFYCFIKSCECQNGQTIEDIMLLVEPYIPLTLENESMDLFMTALFLPEEEQMEVQDYFIAKARGDFITSIQQAKNDEQWSYLLSICESIRSIKETQPVLK